MLKEGDPLKIAFVGTSCTGKTTLFNYFRKNYTADPRIGFSEEGARAYFQENVIPERFTVEIQKAIQDRTIRNEQEALAGNPVIGMTDSSPFDQVIYTKAFGDDEGAEKLYQRISPSIPTYKFYMLDPRDVPFQNDDVRKESADERQRVHDTFVEVFAEKGIVYDLLSGTVEERFQTVDKTVKQILYKSKSLDR